jgi:hypothetical protein
MQDKIFDISGAESSSYQFPGDKHRAIREGAIAVLYDLENGEDTRQYFFSEEEIQVAELKYKDSAKYSIEYL